MGSEFPFKLPLRAITAPNGRTHIVDPHRTIGVCDKPGDAAALVRMVNGYGAMREACEAVVKSEEEYDNLVLDELLPPCITDVIEKCRAALTPPTKEPAND